MAFIQDSFVAETSLGRAAVGFETLTNDVPGYTAGARLEGTDFGVDATSLGIAVNGVSKGNLDKPDGKPVGGTGVSGTANAINGTGVFGIAKGGGTGVYGQSSRSPHAFAETAGVFGENFDASGVGVLGTAHGAIGHGVHGRCNAGTGVYAESDTGTALFATHNGGPTGAAGIFFGPVSVVGPFSVVGTKSAAVPHSDGSHRLLYSVESPESWFEDFGEAKLVKGRAKVRIDPEFAVVADTRRSHVFLTAYGDSQGLFVSARHRDGFEVREQGGGSSSLTFSYRIVAKRKDVNAERFKKVSIPAKPKLPAPLKPPSLDRPPHKSGRSTGAKSKKR
jgi:hypothetical protein